MRQFIMIGLLMFAFVIRLEGSWGIAKEIIVDKVHFGQGVVEGYKNGLRTYYPLDRVLEVEELPSAKKDRR